MQRALSSTWTLVAVVLLSLAALPTRAWAAKPQVAILGLEVNDPSGNVDAKTTTVAKDITDGLRARAKVGGGPYQLAPGSDKELIDEKLIKNCDNEALPCMSQIGKDLGADFLVYGKIEKKSDAFEVTINLLNVTKRKMEKTRIPLRIPLAQSDQKSLAELAKKIYNDLTGVVEAGSLVVTTNVQAGDVFLDDVKRGSLTGGSLTIEGLAENRYRLAVESPGYGRSAEVVVTIRSGDSTPQAVTLTPTAGPTSIEGNVSQGGKKMSVWKPIFVGSLIGGLASGAVLVYGRATYGDTAKIPGEYLANKGSPLTKEIDNGTCGSGDYEQNSPTFDKNCSKYKLTVYGGVGLGVFGALFLVSGYFAFIHDSGESHAQPGTASRGRTRRERLSITPILSPTTGGATVQLDW